MFLKLLYIQGLKVLNVLSPYLFPPRTELSASLIVFLITANTDDTLSVLPVLLSRGCFSLSTHLSSPYGYISTWMKDHHLQLKLSMPEVLVIPE